MESRRSDRFTGAPLLRTVFLSLLKVWIAVGIYFGENRLFITSVIIIFYYYFVCTCVRSLSFVFNVVLFSENYVVIEFFGGLNWMNLCENGESCFNRLKA